MPKINMAKSFLELAQRLADQAEAVCRHYLSNGRREGRYWLVGNIRNTTGRSLFVRLNRGGTSKAKIGHWTDAATTQHGDLLDIICSTCGFKNLRAAAEEARHFFAVAA